MNLDKSNINNIISQSCQTQRNWDISKEIPQEDLDIILTAVTQCPSKQNIAHYNIHSITNRSLIESIHEHTAGFATGYSTDSYMETNSQTLANLLLVFESKDISVKHDTISYRSDETVMLVNGELSSNARDLIYRDRIMSVGIASGYANLISNMLGYKTGYCACFDPDPIRNILNATGDILLMLGIGFGNPDISRLVHQQSGYVYPSKPKQSIQVSWHK
jgi:nitroreductase